MAYVSFSGGKDSSVLLHLVRSIYPDVPAVYCDTGLEFPELKELVRSTENTEILRPKMGFHEVITKYGYPLVSKEVAEAIYYARRNTAQTDRQTDRQTDSRRDENETSCWAGDGTPTERPARSAGGDRRQTIRMRLGLFGKRPAQGGVEQQTIDRLLAQRDLHQTRRAPQSLSERKGYYTTASGGFATCSRERSSRRTESTTGAGGGGNGFIPDSVIPSGVPSRIMEEGNIQSRESNNPQTRNNAGNRDTAGVGWSAFNKTKWLPLAQHAPFRVASYCCNVMKKSPLNRYQTRSKRKPYLGMLAEESRMRKQAWLRHGCNAFDGTKKTSNPLSFWTEQDILTYILRYDVPIPTVYGDIVWTDKRGQVVMPETPGATLTTTGANRTGCVFCGFGMHLEKGETRYQRLKRTHPKLYEYAIGGGQWIDNPDYIEGLPNEPDEIGWIPWNPERIWVPDKHGLGFGFVFDKGNEIYGKELWRYK